MLYYCQTQAQNKSTFQDYLGTIPVVAGSVMYFWSVLLILTFIFEKILSYSRLPRNEMDITSKNMIGPNIVNLQPQVIILHTCLMSRLLWIVGDIGRAVAQMTRVESGRLDLNRRANF